MSSQVTMIGSAELQVIQATLRVDEGRDASIRETASKQLDWHKVQSLAQQHGVSPLVYKRLKEVAPDLVPLAAMQEMAAFQKANELRVIQMTADLIRVVRALEAENIPVICLKGPVLAQVLYGDPAMRLFGDLDILVKQSDYGQAEKVMHKLGLQPVINKLFPTFETTDRELIIERERHFVFPHGKYVLELHWRITTAQFPNALVINDIFARSKKVIFNDQSFFTPGDEDSVLHMCHHAMLHSMEKFRFVTEFSSSISSIGQHLWLPMLNNSRRTGLYFPLLINFGACSKLLGERPPDEIQTIIKNNSKANLVIKRIQLWFSSSLSKRPDKFDRVVYEILTADRNRFQSLFSIIRAMFTPTALDYQWITLPKPFSFLYNVFSFFRRMGATGNLVIARITRR